MFSKVTAEIPKKPGVMWLIFEGGIPLSPSSPPLSSLPPSLPLPPTGPIKSSPVHHAPMGTISCIGYRTAASTVRLDLLTAQRRACSGSPTPVRDLIELSSGLSDGAVFSRGTRYPVPASPCRPLGDVRTLSASWSYGRESRRDHCCVRLMTLVGRK